MATMTTDLFGAAPTTKPTRPSIFRRVMGAMIEARQREAQRQVNGYLLQLDDKTLATYGYDRKELKKLGTTYRTF
ncbi:MAG: hypothetical protein AAGF59_10190 [Pseudomonadota bacterium]